MLVIKLFQDVNNILVGQYVGRAGISFLLYAGHSISAQGITGSYSNGTEFTAGCAADRKVEHIRI